MNWLTTVFGVDKPVIGMCHLPALPGDPSYDEDLGMAGIVAHAEHEIRALQAGGIDGILISNEFSLPYLTKTEPITAAAMARVVGELRPMITVPYGINVLWDARASIDVAVATEASFVREIFTGVYASDFGLWNTNVGKLARHRRRVGASGIRLLFNIVPEAAAYLAARDLGDIAKSTVFDAKPDGLCVSGLTAGSSTDVRSLETVKRAAGSTPVIVNTGVNLETVETVLQVADGAIVGTYFKQDGIFENSVDQDRVARLMEQVQNLRSVTTHA